MASDFTVPGRHVSESGWLPVPADDAEPVVAEEVIALSYARPLDNGVDYTVSRAAAVGLQVAHRAGSLALILLLGAIGALIAGKHAGQLLYWTFGVATLGLLGGSFALFRLSRSPSTEARNVFLFNLIIFATSVTLFLVFR